MVLAKVHTEGNFPGGIMGAVIELKAKEEAGYTEGFEAGSLAREHNLGLSLYQEVGIDDYAKGFRAGFFNQNLRLTGT